MSAFMDFRCKNKVCKRRFGLLVNDEDEFVACPKCGEKVDLTADRAALAEARRSILDRDHQEVIDGAKEEVLKILDDAEQEIRGGPPSSFTQGGEGDGPAP